MRVRRTVLAATLLAAPLSVLVSSPAEATPPNAGCAVGWFLSPVFDIPLFVASDVANHDGFVCLKPVSNGTVVSDNTSAATSGS